MQVPFRRTAGAVLGLALLSVPARGNAASPVGAAASDAWLDATSARWNEVAGRIWSFSETALHETQSSALLADVLEKEGFGVTRGVAGMPTAFVASAGTGTPVVGILAEYDALPGLSQVAGASKKAPRAEGAAGQGCGHNLLGTAAVAAAVAANRTRVAAKLPGTIRVFGTPAEEQLLGKPFMLRNGVFSGTDVVLAWHPADANYVCTKPYLAIAAVDVEFTGRTAHAAMNPWLGRSALDAVELFDHALSLMREHVLPTARLHRVIKNGGLAANIIPDYARVQWFVRDENGERVNEMVGRLRKAAEGAALATETTSKVGLLASTREPLFNEELSKVLQKHLARIGPPRWDAADVALARGIQKEVGVPETGLADTVHPYGPGHGSGASSDVGEVSAAVPVAEVAVATGAAGQPWHHWAVTSCAGHALGQKGMLVAAKVLASSVTDLLSDVGTVAAAKAEFQKARAGKPYVSPLAKDAVPKVY
ncbi:MAG TPA: amidohydrolase [Thermoanaerobaculia bacterium]|nr:amidohydrolase [Thermoanaerobaculia bacterium]